MQRRSHLLPKVMRHIKRPLQLTWAGLIAERIVRAFWPLWVLIALIATAILFGLHEMLSVETFWAALMLGGLGLLVAVLYGIWRFHWPTRQQALDRLDASLAGRPIATLHDTQAIGQGDTASEAMWHAHQKRMAAQAANAKRVEPDLQLSSRDTFGLRYIALLGLLLALVFGSFTRINTLDDVASGAANAAAGPTWEGWIDPPAYTGLPSLYLNDLFESFRVPHGSKLTLRLYGEVGALNVSETVSGRTEDIGAASDPEQSFTITQTGELSIDGQGGESWQVNVTPDNEPMVTIVTNGANTTFDGQMNQPFSAQDDHGIISGTASFDLDLTNIDRRFGLAIEPEPRKPLELDLPLPINGDRAMFTENLVENLSEHAWANLPVTLTLQVRDALDQTGQSDSMEMNLPARSFFDPLAASIIEQRRDLLWSRENAPRILQVLRAISHNPNDTLFRSNTDYLVLRSIIRRLDTLVSYGQVPTQARDDIAAAMWELAVRLEDGDIGDALERMRKAQERLSEAIRQGASEEEIARLMQELRDATRDYLRQQAQQQRRRTDEQGLPQMSQEMMELTQQDLQDMMDRIQELMEEGKFAEAQQALEEFQQMMENLQVTEGQQGQGQEGQQSMNELADTLREQQGLSDEAFRDLQEQFNPNAQSGQAQDNTGRSGGEGRGQDHEGSEGEGQGNAESGQGGDRPGGGSLADRQEALRQELQRQRGRMPGAGTEGGDGARDALDRAGEAMEQAENSLRENDLSGAIDRQAEAIDALRDGMQSLGEQLAQNNSRRGGEGDTLGQFGQEQSDPLGRTPGQGNQVGTQESLLQGEDVYRRARELLDEIRRRSGEGARPEVELDYLKRLLERF